MKTFVSTIKLQRSKRNYMVAINASDAFVDQIKGMQNPFNKNSLLKSLEMTSADVFLLNVSPAKKFINRVFSRLNEQNRIIAIDPIFGSGIIDEGSIEPLDSGSIIMYRDGSFRIRFDIHNGKFVWETGRLTLKDGNIEIVASAEVVESDIDEPIEKVETAEQF